MKKAIILLFLFLLPLGVLAYEVKTEDTITVSKDEVIKGSLYAGGGVVVVDGTIDGDLFCAAQTVEVNGTVNGDIICAAQNIDINGEVKGNVRVIGNSITIAGKVAKNANVFGSTIFMKENAGVGGEFLTAGIFENIAGEVGGDLHGAVSELKIGANVGGDVKFLFFNNKISEKPEGKNDAQKKSPFIISSGASVLGDIDYSAHKPVKIEEGALVGGSVNFKKINAKGKSRALFIESSFNKIYNIFSSIVIGLVIVSIFKSKIKDLTKEMYNNPASSFGWGFAILFIVPLASVILLFTMIGIPLSILLILFWTAGLIIAKVVSAIMIGVEINRQYLKPKKDSLFWSMVMGVVLLQLLSYAPFVGWIFSLGALLWGLGGIWLYLRGRLTKMIKI